MNDIYVDESTWEYQKSIRVRQSVWLSRADEDASKRDACTVTYSVEELGNFGEEVELRVVIDTRIGNNNGCSFLLSPGQKPIRVADLRDQDVPRKLLALENADATGLLARLQLPSPHESPNAQQPPNRLTITSYGEIGRDWDVKATETEKDTAIVMYWGPRRLARNGDRLVAGYSYGKGQLADLKSP